MALQPKYLRALDPIVVGARHLKRYHVSNDETPIDAAIERAAYELLPRLVPAPDGSTPPGGWVILHQGGDGAAYLNAYSWVWDNVIEFHAAAAGQPMVDCPDDDPTHFVPLERPWIGCIWELPPFGHERSAWVRHVFGADVPDLDAYLADHLPDGPTGQPN
jgi:hypothetical protein